MYYNIEVDYDEDKHTVVISNDGSSGCEYECNSEHELKQLVLDYVKYDIFGDIDEENIDFPDPCPFCGSEATLKLCEDEYGNRLWTVFCNSDKCACGIGYFDTKEEALRNWNRRVR